ncbi:MAG: alcohol dehydrogenase catalytic domain-containing protein [Verrucomicrobia bacterium]|nr:alcohol dehydrogenase catalytic domain-containing protein [Verrucomicrobiota bacterium]
MKMKAVFYTSFEHLEIAERPVPTPTPGEVLLRVAACGICGSELETFKNRSPRRSPPLIMGHEFCGVVESTGQRVVSNSLVPCGACVRCHRGDTHLCAHRQIFGMHRPGAFAEYVNVPARCLIPWPEGLPAEAACLAEPLGNGVHIVNLTRHLPMQSVLVIGAGPIGLMCQQAFQVLRAARVFVADLSEERLQVAVTLGANRVIRSRQEDVVQVLRVLTDGEGVDVVVDAVGATATKKQSLAAVRPGGAVVWIGLHENTMTLDSYDITLPEKQVLGTYAVTLTELRRAVDLMATGQVDVTSWVQTFPLDRGVEAFRRMLAAQGADIKAVIKS